MLNPNISYVYEPKDWHTGQFIALGGYTAVFLNYNKKAQVQESVRSVLAQDYPKVEIILMDDASTDGSGDIMEQIARSYKGPHRVLVIRNLTNHGITGQWNIAARIATGEWLGMFCADDIAYQDRIRKIADIITKNPTLKGVCTSGIEKDYLTGEVGRRLDGIGGGCDLCPGVTSLDILSTKSSPICGATAFWHKSLFVDKLPSAPYDDVLLRWVLQLKYKDIADTIWMWNGDIETITYGVGTGISSTGREIVKKDVPLWYRRLAKMKHAKCYFCNIEKTWSGILEYYLQKNAPGSFIAVAHNMKLIAKLESANTFVRLVSLPKVITLLASRNLGVRNKKLLVKTWFEYFCLELFGLRVGALCAPTLKKIKSAFLKALGVLNEKR